MEKEDHNIEDDLFRGLIALVQKSSAVHGLCEYRRNEAQDPSNSWVSMTHLAPVT